MCCQHKLWVTLFNDASNMTWWTWWWTWWGWHLIRLNNLILPFKEMRCLNCRTRVMREGETRQVSVITNHRTIKFIYRMQEIVWNQTKTSQYMWESNGILATSSFTGDSILLVIFCKLIINMLFADAPWRRAVASAVQNSVIQLGGMRTHSNNRLDTNEHI